MQSIAEKDKFSLVEDSKLSIKKGGKIFSDSIFHFTVKSRSVNVNFEILYIITTEI